MSGSGSSCIYSSVKVYNDLLNLHFPRGHTSSLITQGALGLLGAGSDARLKICKQLESEPSISFTCIRGSGLEIPVLASAPCTRLSCLCALAGTGMGKVIGVRCPSIRGANSSCCDREIVGFYWLEAAKFYFSSKSKVVRKLSSILQHWGRRFR